MSEICLHHYPASPFSEKIRALAGYLQLEWHSIETSVIMPRPLLTPLSGGYRRIPVAQVGADVFCDTKVICRELAELAGDDTLYAAGFAATRVADEADTTLFRIMASLSFRPEAIKGTVQASGGGTTVSLEDLLKDRADLAGGGDIIGMTPDVAEGALLQWLTELDSAVQSGFLFGDKPSIADFAVYPPLWFLGNNPFNAPLVEAHRNVMDWIERIRAFGHGKVIPSEGEAALAIARNAEPRTMEAAAIGTDAAPGARVRITPTDYGRVPVEGELVRADAWEFAIRRTSTETGPIIIHFPRTGFALEHEGIH